MVRVAISAILAIASAAHGAPTHFAVLDGRDVVIQSLTDGSQRRIEVGVQFPGILPPCAFAAAGRNFAVNDFCGGGHVLLYNFDGEVVRRISAGPVYRVELSDDGQAVAAFSEEFGSHYVDVSFPDQGGVLVGRSIPGTLVTSVFADNRTLALTVVDGDEYSLVLIGPEGTIGSPIRLPGEPEYGVGLLTVQSQTATATATPSPTSTPTSPTAVATTSGRSSTSASGGCKLDGSSGATGSWLTLGIGALLLAGARKRLLVPVLLLVCANQATAARPLFSANATLRIDHGDLQPLPRPDGPPQTITGGQGGGAAGSCDVPDDDADFPSSFVVPPPPPGTYDLDLAVDVVNWRSQLADVQQVINFLNAHYHAANAIFLRSAGIRFRVVHVHIWNDTHPYGNVDNMGPIDNQWGAVWPRCPAANCVDRDLVQVLVVGGGGRKGQVQTLPSDFELVRVSFRVCRPPPRVGLGKRNEGTLYVCSRARSPDECTAHPLLRSASGPLRFRGGWEVLPGSQGVPQPDGTIEHHDVLLQQSWKWRVMSGVRATRHTDASVGFPPPDERVDAGQHCWRTLCDDRLVRLPDRPRQ